MRTPYIRLMAVSILFVSLVSCKGKLSEGHYEGNLTWKDYSNTAATPVGIDISYRREEKIHLHSTAFVDVTDTRGKSIITLAVRLGSDSKIHMSVPTLYGKTFQLENVHSKADNTGVTCYLDKSAWIAELCLDDQRFHLKITNDRGEGVLKLLGDTFIKETDPVLETPQVIPLDQAVQHGLSANLDSQISFEHAIQAKYAVTAAYLNLIPHLTSNLIWNAQFGYISVIATLQGIAPFLLPTFWLSARETQYDGKIKRDAETILKADLAAMIEQLAYAYDRDQQIGKAQADALNSLNNAIVIAADLEKRGAVPAGSTDSLVEIVKSVMADQDKTQGLIQEDRYVVSQILGFHNPDGVTAITVPELQVGSPLKQIQKNEFAEVASHRSFELRQIDYLKRITELKKIELYFAWIDPSGDPKSSLGFNTIFQVKNSNSQIHELEIKRDQLKNNIYFSSYRIVDQYNSTLDYVNQYFSSSHGPVLSLDEQLKQCLQNSFTPEKARAIVGTYLTDQIGVVSNLATYRIAKSKLDRLILDGFYAYLIPFLDEFDNELNSTLK